MKKYLWIPFVLVACIQNPNNVEPVRFISTTPIETYDAVKQPVEVIFDNVGTPHIYAQDDLDLYFAAGYQQGIDRMFALDLNRRAAIGTQSEILGGERLGGDIQARVIGFRQLAERALEDLRTTSPHDYNIVVAFTGGLNRAVSEYENGERQIPEEYRRLDFAPTQFSTVEVFSHAMRLQFAFSSTLDFDLLNTLVDVVAPDATEVAVHTPVNDTLIVGPDSKNRSIQQSLQPSVPSNTLITKLNDEELRDLLRGIASFRSNLAQGDGSNAWTVHGRHTSNGKPMLASDSHSRYFTPNSMYVSHLNSMDGNGSYDVAGFGFGGVPGVQVGINRHIGWGATTAFGDCTDLWNVQVTEDGTGVEFGDQIISLETREERIGVLQPDGSIVEQVIVVETVPNVGVVMPPELLPVPPQLLGDGKLVLGWPGFGFPISDFRTFLHFAKSESASEFRSAVNTQVTGMQNWHFVDAVEMGHQTGSLVPDRGEVPRPRSSVVMDGSDPKNLWSGEYLDRELLPAVFNDRDFIVSANNDPFGHTLDGDPHNDAFYFGSFYSPHFRAELVEEKVRELVDRGNVTVDDMLAVQMNNESGAFPKYKRFIDDAIAALNSDTPEATEFETRREDLLVAYDVLTNWNGLMERPEQGAALFRMFVAILARNMLQDDLNLLFDTIANEQPVFMIKFTLLALEQNAQNLLDGTAEEIVLQSLVEAYDLWVARGEPTWAFVLQGEWTTPDRRPEFQPVDGGDTTITVAQCRFYDGSNLRDRCTTRSGSVWRFVVSFEDEKPVMVFTSPETETGITADWREGNYQPMYFDRAEIEANAVYRYWLQP